MLCGYNIRDAPYGISGWTGPSLLPFELSGAANALRKSERKRVRYERITQSH